MNFKSIKEFTIIFDENYHVLAGKNESGKTNILEAISYLDNKKPIDKTNIREPLPDEEPISTSEIKFVFTPRHVNKKVTYELYKSLFTNYDDVKDNIFIKYFSKEISIEQFFNERLECLITVDFIKNTRPNQYWTISNYYKFRKWRKIVVKTPPNTKLIIPKNWERS